MAEVNVRFRLQLLGHLCLASDAGTVPLGSGRSAQLLAYLAVRGLWQSRDDVARLFWPDRPSKIARSNLRTLLCKISAAWPFAAMESTEHALRFAAPSDLNDFDAALQCGDMEAAVRIGAAELLKGIEAHASEPYLLWLQSARLVQASRWTSAVRAMLAQPSRPIEQREALAEAWGLQCPDDEEAVHARLKIASERQQTGAVATIFKAFDARLQREFGVRPSRSLERFASEAALTSPQSSAMTPAPRAAAVGASGLAPARVGARSRLFGRRLELGQAKALLSDSEVRLVVLSGPGGVGKSTLLAAISEQCSADGCAGICWVDASAAPTAEAVIAAIATALGIDDLPSADGADSAAALAGAIRNRECLLMIDGAEQPGLAQPLALILQRCPCTRFVLASRSQLPLDSARVLALDGFPLPDHDETDTTVLGRNDAVCFFVKLMAQAGQAADLARDASTLSALVHAVDGLPLALKLLAKLTRFFSLTQLLASLRLHLEGTKAGAWPEFSELLPALVASFERSWVALTPSEQAVLARLAVFPAPFDVVAARSVASTPLPIITALIDRSLVRADGAGRLSLHAAIRSCLLVTCPLSDAAWAAHTQFYVERLATLAGVARVKTVQPLQKFLRDESAHLEHAWRTALERRAYPALLSMVQGLFPEAMVLGNVAGYLSWFADAEGSLRNEVNVPQALRAYLLAGSANALRHQGKNELAVRPAIAALRAAQRARHRDAIGSAMTVLVMAYLGSGKLKAAEAVIARLAALDDEDFSTNLLDLRSMFSMATADYEAALQRLDELIAIERRLGKSTAVIASLMNKWTVCVEADDIAQGSQVIEQVLAATEGADVGRHLRASVLIYAAQWYVDLGDSARSRDCVKRANAIDTRSPLTWAMRMKLELVMAAIAVLDKDLGPAAQSLACVLAGIERGELLSTANKALVCAAKWLQLAGDRDACLVALRAIRGGLFERGAAQSAQTMLLELGEAHPPQGEPSDRAQRSPDELAEVARHIRARILGLWRGVASHAVSRNAD